MKRIFILLLSILLFILIANVQMDMFSSSLKANTNSTASYSEDGVDREPGGRKIEEAMVTSWQSYFVSTENNEIYSWGKNSNSTGHLGVGDLDDRTIPTKIDFDFGEIDHMYGGIAHFFVLNKNNELFAWGMGDSGKLTAGKLGTGSSNSEFSPVKIDLPISNPKQMMLIRHSSYLLNDDGKIFGTGKGTATELGDTIGTDVKSFQEITEFNSLPYIEKLGKSPTGLSATSSYVIDNEGKVYGLGPASGGTFGNGQTSINTCVSPAVKIDGGCYYKPGTNAPIKKDDASHSDLTGIIQVAVANNNGVQQNMAESLAIQDADGDGEGQLWAWGYNASGQLGNNTTTNQGYATKVLGVDGVGYLNNVVDVSLSDNQSYAVS